jgi:eukaryotic-like serine/threonine-protein kinase
MTGSDPRWLRVSQLVAEALEQPAAERATFLAHACPDEALRAEVESLLEAHERASSRKFLEQPAAAAMPELLDEDMGLVGRTVGHYEIRRVIGRGGMGVVFLADDTRLGRKVALKAVPPDLWRDVRTRERLRREARAAAALSHPAIATVYALEEADGRLFIASEYVNGRSLREEVAAGPVPPEVLVATARAIAGALAAAHGQGIVHRDLKPENVLRRNDGQIKVLDFGLARMTDPPGTGTPAPTRTLNSLSLTGVVAGTPGYMAPEQLRGERVDARADVFSFGVLLFELAIGKHPLGSGDAGTLLAALLEGRTPLPADGFPVPALEPILRRCLRARPDDRFASGAELLAALSALEPPATAVDDGRPNRRIAWWRFHQAAISLFHAATLVGLWLVRGVFPAPWGNLVFYTALAAQTAAVTMRLHLWFSSRVLPDLLAAQRARVARSLVLLDLIHGVLLLVTAVQAANAGAPSAPLFTIAAVISLLALALIEPATTKAAFRSRGD